MKFIHTFLLLLLYPFASRAQTINISATDTTICSGTPVTFSATSLSIGAPHFQWWVNNAAVGVDSAGYTTATLNNSDSVFCILYNSTFDTALATSDTIVVSVHSSLPDAGTLSGPDRVCVGTTVTLAATVPGGTWSTANGHASVVEGVVRGETSGFFECPYDGIDTVLYTIVNYCGADTATHKIAVRVVPSPLVDLVFPWSCPFQDFVFTGPRCFSYTYIDTIAIGRSCIEGWLYAVSTNECGRDTNKYYQPVSICTFVTDMPHILSSTDKLCMGTILPIAAADDYYTPLWKISNDNASLKDSAGVLYLRPNKTGLTTITLSYQNICGTSSMTKYDTLIVNIHAQPHIDSVVGRLCVDGKVQLNAQPTGGTWTSTNPYIATIDSLTGKASGIGPGTMQLTYAIGNACYATSDLTVENCANDAWLTPLPVRNELTLHVVEEGAYTHCTITNAAGQLMHRQQLTGTSATINTAWYASAVYFMRLSGHGKEKVLKFLKQ